MGFRGKGSSHNEILDDPDGTVTWWNTLEGVAGEDAIAPTISFSSMDVTKLRRPAGAYSLKLRSPSATTSMNIPSRMGSE